MVMLLMKSAPFVSPVCVILMSILPCAPSAAGTNLYFTYSAVICLVALPSQRYDVSSTTTATSATCTASLTFTSTSTDLMTPSMPLVNSDTLEAGFAVVPIICPIDAV